ncbi:MAG: serine protease [Gammaproteobacteria bacterium]|nr:serine protease [Gammaproteobacteria bacterium]
MSEVRCSRIASCCIAQWLAIGLLLVSPARPGAGLVSGGHVATLVDLSGPIGPAMSRYVQQSLVDAGTHHSTLVIFRMDTPGGLDTSMRDIIKAILASPVPVVTYVAPSGARAASAGTYILYSSHLAAMAPATNLGAATPISIGGEPTTPPPVTQPPLPPGNSGGDKQKAPEEIPAGTAAERKAVNDAVAYIRSLAQLRGRNADWAEAAVRGGASLSADDALEQHVIDIVAKDVPDLLLQLHGRKVNARNGEVVLDTRGLEVSSIAPDWRTRMLMVLTHPTIAYGLLLIGIYGLLLEGYNPGAVLPGVVGALSLLLGLYGMQLLAVNYAGLALMALGTGLIVAEFFMPTFGSLGIGGLAAFVIGSLILFDNGASGTRVALPLIVGIAVAGGLVVAAIGWLAARARRRPVSTGIETMIGAPVEAIGDCQDKCLVRYGGELWNARTTSPLRAGQRARIVRVVELTLWVEPQPD